MARTFILLMVATVVVGMVGILGTGCPPANDDLQKVIFKALSGDGCRGCDSCNPEEGEGELEGEPEGESAEGEVSTEGECTFTPKICAYGPFACDGESKFEKCISSESYRFEDCSTGAEVLSREWFLNGQSHGSDPSFSECFDVSSSVALSVNTVCGTFTTSTTIEVGYNIEACFEIAYDPVEPLVIDFDISCTQGSSHGCNYPIEEWDFGDGTQDVDWDGSHYYHRYGQPGTYSVCLRLDCGDECKKENLLRNSSNKNIFCIDVTVPKPAEGEEVEGEVVLEGEGEGEVETPVEGEGETPV